MHLLAYWHWERQLGSRKLEEDDARWGGKGIGPPQTRCPT